MKKKTLETIGWREWIALPELGIKRIKAKVDTGARTSSLHAENIRIVRKGRKATVHFSVFPKQRDHKEEKRTQAPLIDERLVKSSNGKSELRPVIECQLAIGDEVWPIEITLTSRDLMGFRMLLGRQAVRKHALVDPGRSYLSDKK